MNFSLSNRICKKTLQIYDFISLQAYLPSSMGDVNHKFVGVADGVGLTIPLKAEHREAHCVTHRLGLLPTPFDLEISHLW